jgi:hypothetical protein
MKATIIRGFGSHPQSFAKTVWRRLAVASASAALLVSIPQGTTSASTVVFDTEPYWAAVQGILGGMGPEQTPTIAETFVAPAGTSVTLNDFSFYAESYYPAGGVADLRLRAFVFAWSGSMTGKGGGAVGSPVYMSPGFDFSPPGRPSGWVPLTANLGTTGVSLTPGGHYVMGFTLSNPADYAASHGDIEFKEVPNRDPYEPELPLGVDGFGGAVWFNNSNNVALLNTAVWDTWGDTGDMAFTAHLTVVPEPATVTLAGITVSCCAYRCRRTKRARR